MFYEYMPQNCYLAFLGQGLAFFGEDRLATLLCGSARFDLANRGVHQPIQPHAHARLFVFDETLQGCVCRYELYVGLAAISYNKSIVIS